MGRIPGFRGVYAVAWSQTELGEERALAPEFMSIGMSWCWHGNAFRLDPGPATLWLDRPTERADPRGRARSRMARLALSPATPRTHATLPDTGALGELAPDSFALTDGQRLYHARVLRQRGQLLAVFDPLMPPPGQMLWISALNLAPEPPRRRAGVICFVPGTRIETESGARAVEMLRQGDKVRTRDNGLQPVVWCGATQLTGAELYLHPHLRPVRISAGAMGGARPDADLLVSPGHRLLVRDGEALFNASEVLVAAADLEDGRRVRRDFTLGTVTYVHLMLERHEIITANGVACESFHPGLADPTVLKWHARALERASPGLVADPARFGAAARRCLDTAQARILLHATQELSGTA